MPSPQSFSPDLVDHLLILLRAPAQGVAEIPAEIWELDTLEIAAYLGVIAVNPGKQYIAEPPEEVWARVVHFLTVAGAEYKFHGRVEECLRLARLAISLDEELTHAYWGTAIDDALNEPACASWPLANLTILEKYHAEGSPGSGDAEPAYAAG